MSSRFLIVACCVAVQLLLPHTVGAQDPSEERARIHFQSGTVHYDTGDFEAALREFQAAYRLSPRPALLYNMYLAHERLGNIEQAIENLEGYLENGDVPEERRPVLEQRLANLNRRLRDEAGTEQPPRPATEDAPPAHPEETEPDVDRPSVEQGSVGTAASEAPPGSEPQTMALDGELTDANGAGGVPLGAWLAFGAGAVGAATWATFGVMAMLEHSSLEDSCADRPCTEDDVSDLRTFNLLADVGAAVTFAGALTGVLVLMLSSGDETERDTALTWAPWIGGGSAGVSAGGSL